MQLLALPIAAAFVVIALLPLARQYFRQSPFWILLIIGTFAFPIVQWIYRLVWEPAAFSLGVPQAGAGLVLNLCVGAFLGEAIKVAPAIIVSVWSKASRRDWFAYGAAAGAGYALFGAQQVIRFALEVSRLPLSTPGSTALAIGLRLFPILAHVATTAFAAWAASRGRLGRGLLIATAAQVILGLVERGQASMGQALGQLLFALIAVFLFVYVWMLRDRSLSGPSRQAAG